MALATSAMRSLPTTGQVQTPRREPEDNIACDIEAALVALYGRRLVTRNGVAQELDEDLRLIANAVWPANLRSVRTLLARLSPSSDFEPYTRATNRDVRDEGSTPANRMAV
jgi:hypothetical protein